MNGYRQTQAGHVMRVFLCGGMVVFSAVTVLAVGSWWPAFIIILALGVTLLLFHQLTVQVGNGVIALRFGVGLIRKTFRLADVASCQAVRNRWYYGWGVKWTPHGWLFNVSGLSAVEVRMKNGRTYRIGSDEPDALAQAIRDAGGIK